MKTGIIAIMCLAIVVIGSPAQAFIFGPSSSTIAEVCERYFFKEEADLDDFLDLDLAIIESGDDARVLYRILRRLVRAERKEVKEMESTLEWRQGIVERHLDRLYDAEVQDAAWLNKRPTKQMAYRSAAEAYWKLYSLTRERETRLIRSQEIRNALRRISRRFEAVQP